MQSMIIMHEVYLQSFSKTQMQGKAYLKAFLKMDSCYYNIYNKCNILQSITHMYLKNIL